MTTTASTTLPPPARTMLPKVVTRPGRPGFYIRVCTKRSAIKDLSVTIRQSDPLPLALTKYKTVALTEDPTSGSLFANYLKKGDEILCIGSVRVHAVDDVRTALQDLQNQLVKVRINKGGGHGSVPHYIKAGRTREIANAFAKKWDGILPSERSMIHAEDITFGHLADHFIEWASTSGDYSPAWLAECKRIMKLHKDRWGTTPIQDLTADVISDWANQRRKDASYYVVSNELKPLRAAYTEVLKMRSGKWKRVTFNPATGIKIRPPGASMRKPLEYSDALKLIEVAATLDKSRLEPGVSPKGGATVLGTRQTIEETQRHYNTDGTFDAARIRFLLNTGLRRSQLIDLLWSDYDEAKGSIVLQTTKRHREKSRRVTTFPVPKAAREIIAGQPRTSTYIFPNLQGHRDACIQKRLQRIDAVFKKETGSHAHLHLFRHTAGNRLYDKCSDIAAVSRFLGHSRIQTTQRYVQVSDQHLRNVAEDFDITMPAPTPVPVLSATHDLQSDTTNAAIAKSSARPDVRCATAENVQKCPRRTKAQK